MRAWQVTRPGEPREALTLAEVEAPEPGPGFLRVRVTAAALGLPDLFLCRGSYALTPTRPFTPGQEVSGVVTAAGEGARAVVGDRVMGVTGFFLGHGGFAEEALVLDDFAFTVPETLTDAEAAGFLIPFHTAYVGLVQRGALAAGETLLVLGGAGGTGSAAIQLGAALGARVVATASSEAKAAFCRELGAEAVVDARSGDLAAQVREASDGRGADVVYDTVGGDAFAAATRAVAHEGRILVVGFASGRWGQPDPAHLVMHNYSVLGVVPTGYDRAFKEEAQRALLAHVERGALRIPIERRFPFEALPDALHSLGAEAPKGKWVLEVGEPA